MEVGSLKLYVELETYPDPFGSRKMDGEITFHVLPNKDRTEIEITAKQIFEITAESEAWDKFLENNGVDLDLNFEEHQKEIDALAAKNLLVEGVCVALNEDGDTGEFYYQVYSKMMKDSLA